MWLQLCKNTIGSFKHAESRLWAQGKVQSVMRHMMDFHGLPRFAELCIHHLSEQLKFKMETYRRSL